MDGVFNMKCLIDSNEQLGRYVKCQEAISAGETVLCERPAIILPHSDDKRCTNCFKRTGDYCKLCVIMPLCSDCSNHDNFDCNFLSGTIDVDFNVIKSYPGAYALLKMLLLKVNPDTSQVFDKMFNLESHTDKRRNSAIWEDHKINSIEPFFKSKLNDHFKIGCTVDEDFLQHLCGVLDVNCFEVRAPDENSMRALYINASLLAHACNANCNVSVDHEHRIKIYANTNIKANSLVTHCYVNSIMGTDDRRCVLYETKYFYCHCARCQDPTELGSHMSTLICDRCTDNKKEGLLMRNDIDGNIWTCQNCQYNVSGKQVSTMLQKIKQDIRLADGNLSTYELLLTQLSKILHKNHYLMFEIRTKIAMILRSMALSNTAKSGIRLLERKACLYQELVLALHTIHPGISRMKATTLHELGVISNDYYRMQYENMEISLEKLIYLLKQCCSMFSEAIKMLLYESPETPEGILARNITVELNYLRNDIQNMENEHTGRR